MFLSIPTADLLLLADCLPIAGRPDEGGQRICQLVVVVATVLATDKLLFFSAAAAAAAAAVFVPDYFLSAV